MTCRKDITNRRRPHAARGMTFLETVAAVFMLSLMAASVFTALGYINRSFMHQRHKLGAMELTNTLVLSYLHDPGGLISQPRRINYLGEQYRWDVNVEWADMYEPNLEGKPGRGRARERNGASTNRMKIVVVDVWLGEESGGAMRADPGVPSARLWRLFDPLRFVRNPSSTERLFDGGDMYEILKDVQEAERRGQMR